MTQPPSKKTWLDLPWQPFASAFALLYLVLAALAARTFFHAKGGNYHGDFIHFYWAAQAMVNHQDLYTSGLHGYIYPPLVAFLFQPLAFLSERGADVAWLVANLLLNAGSVLLATHAIMRRLHFPKSRTMFFGIALFAAALSVDKIRADFALGQTDALMILSFALILLWFDKNPLLTGLAVGFGVCVKYLQLIYLPYFFFRRKYAAIAASLLGIAFFSLLPATTSGWNENLHNLHSAYAGMFSMAERTTATRPADETPATHSANIENITWDRSISLTSAFMRVDDTYRGHKLIAAADLALFVGSFMILTFALYKKFNIPLFFRRPTHPANNTMLCAEWAVLLILTLILGPQTAPRHMVMLLPAYALAAALILAPGDNIRRLPLLLATLLLSLSLILPTGDIALNTWRTIAGPSICAVIFSFILLHAALDYAAKTKNNPVDAGNTSNTESPETLNPKPL